MAQPRAVTLHFQTQDVRINIDCTDQFEPQYSAEVTRYPTEKGNPITDHRDIQPDMLTLGGQMSDVHPYRTNDTESIDPFAPVAYNPEATGFHTNFRDVLLTAHRNSELITVEAGKRGTWSDMLLLPFNLPSTPDSGAAVFFSLQLIKLTIVETQTKDISKPEASPKLEAANTTTNQQAIATDGGSNVVNTPIAGAKKVASPDVVYRHSPLENQGSLSPRQADISAALTQPFNGAPPVGAWAR